MRIQHNISALNAHRQLGNNNSFVSRNLEKLSSGYRINKAGDDAAGLAISEKMRAQIKGLDTAQKNAQDGISLVQTAEGALTEVHSMLNRMTELATQSANGTYDNKTDRDNLQKEVNSLKTEIDRIAESTNYNGIKLLDGSLSTDSATAAKPAAGAANPNAPKAILLEGDMTVTNNAATKSSWTAGAATGTAGSTAGNMNIKINYLDANGSAKEKTLTIATTSSETQAAVNTKIINAIAADDDLKDLFVASEGTSADAGKLIITSKETGKNAPKVTDVVTSGTVTSIVAGAGTGVAGADKSATIQFGGSNGAATAPKDGTTLKIGEKTYEFLSDVSKVKEGNVAVQITPAGGTSGKANADALIAALKANGVSSAANGANTYEVVIGNLDEISVAQDGITIGSTSKGVQVNKTSDVAGSYEVTTQAGTAGGHKLTVEYLDEEGKKQSLTVDYTSTGAVPADTSAMEAALKADENFSKLFDVSVDAANNKLIFNAKTAGTEGARVIGVKNDETNQGANGISGGVVVATEAQDAGKTIELDAALKDGDEITIDGKTYQFTSDPSKVKDGNIAVTYKSTGAAPNTADLKDMSKNLANALKSNGADFTFDASSGKITFKDDAKAANEAGNGLVLQVGDTSDDYQKVTVSVGDMSSDALGIGDIDISQQNMAQAAIDKIKAAINTVSATRGDLGAIQNRLDHTINNLGVASENMSAAESRIRDVDMAKEMMDFTKNNILTQASQAMLAQANQLPQGVLQLLQ